MLLGYTGKKRTLYFMENVWYGYLFKYFTMMYRLQNLHNNYKLKKC